MQILTKAAYILSLTILLGRPGSAETADSSLPGPRPTSDGLSETQKISDAPVIPVRAPLIPLEGAVFEPLGDIFGGKEHSHPELLRIATQASVGNRDGVEISLALYRKFGLRRDMLQEFIEDAKLHSDTSVLPQLFWGDTHLRRAYDRSRPPF